MKRLLLTITAFAASMAGVIAQTPDYNFETWAPAVTGAADDPQGWASLNALTFLGGAQSVFKDTTNPFEGTTSAKITTIKVTGFQIPNPYNPGHDLDTVGLLTIGAVSMAPPGIVTGTPFSGRPTVLSFASKYTPMAGDSAFVGIILSRWNGTSRDTVAKAMWSTGATTSSYASNNLNLEYTPSLANVQPDTLQLFISSSVFQHPGAKIGSTFYIDKLEFSGWNSVNELSGKNANTVAYPNPASSVLTFESNAEDATYIEVVDITGRTMGNYSLTNGKVTVDISVYSQGMYLYNAYTAKKVVVSRGRFEVTK